MVAILQEAVGITHFNCSFWVGDLEHARVLRSMETFAREVMPAASFAVLVTMQPLPSDHRSSLRSLRRGCPATSAR